MGESMEQTEASALEQPPAPLQAPPPEPPAEPSETRNSITEWAITILLLVFLTTALLQAFVIPTGSMEDTLLIGDHLLVDKMAYGPSGIVGRHILPFREPQRGDIIVFRYPIDIKQTFVKRVIGVPGDRIRIVNKQVFRNGAKLYEPYIYHKTDYVQAYRDNFPSEPETHLEAPGLTMLQNNVEHGDLVVPPGVYFAMGDNRDFSFDSRYWGFVPRDNIIGKPLIVYWSYAAPTEELTEQSLPRHLLSVFAHFFTRTRWNRTFLLIHGYRK
ncbi:MAG: signal peptidase I [Bryobacteraceae bacterium]|jgi:signal peptidase I